MKKDFETLYKIAMHMADTALLPEHLEFKNRINKLNEEFTELLIECNKIGSEEHKKYMADEELPGGGRLVRFQDEYKQAVVNEASDMLFVLLHFIYQLGGDPMSSLQYVTTKMIGRLNDPDYEGKIKG